ncbi:MAG: hypothetical protein ABI693_09295 [Bryobacteraceae bacterium]
MKMASKQPESRRAAATAKPAGAVSHLETKGPETPKDVAAAAQRKAFDEAMQLFHGGDFRGARERFVMAGGDPDVEIAHAAGLHVSMCDQRLGRLTPVLDTPEDHYNYAIALINKRQLVEADRQLKVAIEALPGADHVLYAQALSRALQGDLEGSYQHLKRAIQANPRNRSLARTDPDFQDACRRPPLRELVHPQS